MNRYERIAFDTFAVARLSEGSRSMLEHHPLLRAMVMPAIRHEFRRSKRLARARGPQELLQFFLDNSDRIIALIERIIGLFVRN